MAACSRTVYTCAGALAVLAYGLGCARPDAPHGSVRRSPQSEAARNNAAAAAAPTHGAVGGDAWLPGQTPYAEHLEPPRVVGVGTLAEWEGQPSALTADDAIAPTAPSELPASISGGWVSPGAGR